MKTLVVLKDNCGDEAEAFHNWLIANLPDDVKLDWRERTSGVGGGLFDEDWNQIHDPYWDAYCDS